MAEKKKWYREVGVVRLYKPRKDARLYGYLEKPMVGYVRTDDEDPSSVYAYISFTNPWSRNGLTSLYVDELPYRLKTDVRPTHFEVPVAWLYELRPYAEVAVESLRKDLGLDGEVK